MWTANLIFETTCCISRSVQNVSECWLCKSWKVCSVELVDESKINLKFGVGLWTIPWDHSILKGSAMPSKDDSTDAVHMRFREKDLLKQFYCFDCAQTFAATQILDVFQHYKETQHVQFHSNCLYCDGRVYQYRDGDHKIQYYHNCFRWKQGLDRWKIHQRGSLYLFL